MGLLHGRIQKYSDQFTCNPIPGISANLPVTLVNIPVNLLVKPTKLGQTTGKSQTTGKTTGETIGNMSQTIGKDYELDYW